jgi:hypothetical protein
MGAKRTGKYGEYRGSLYTESGALTTGEMFTNAHYIKAALIADGWTSSAICAVLGNMQAESGLNPGRWQSDRVGNLSGGYGLVQWTPATNYIDWCSTQNLSDPSEMDNNIARIIYEVENGLQWIPTNSYPLTFQQFKISTQPVEYLARAFLLNYERPADQSTSVQSLRSSYAVNWFRYLYGGSGGGIYSPKKKGSFNFILFNRRRRMQKWKRTRY